MAPYLQYTDGSGSIVVHRYKSHETTSTCIIDYDECSNYTTNDPVEQSPCDEQAQTEQQQKTEPKRERDVFDSVNFRPPVPISAMLTMQLATGRRFTTGFG